MLKRLTQLLDWLVDLFFGPDGDEEYPSENGDGVDDDGWPWRRGPKS